MSSEIRKVKPGTRIELFPKPGRMRTFLERRGFITKEPTHQQTAQLVEKVKPTIDLFKRGGLFKDFDEAAVPMMIDGFLDGIEWALEKFQCSTYPNVNILQIINEHQVATENLNGYHFAFAGHHMVTDDLLLYESTLVFMGDKKFDTAKSLFQAAKAKGLQVDFRECMKQLYASLGVHEAIHFLQKHHAPGLTPDDRRRLDYNPHRDQEKYMEDQYEDEARRYQDEFCQDKFGYNPYQLLFTIAVPQNKV